MKEAKQYGEWVKASEEVPNSYCCKIAGGYTTLFLRGRAGDILRFEDSGGFVVKKALIEWLRPTSGILLQQQEYEGLMKCVDVLKRMYNGGQDFSESFSIYRDADEALSQLPETIK